MQLVDSSSLFESLMNKVKIVLMVQQNKLFSIRILYIWAVVVELMIISKCIFLLLTLLRSSCELLFLITHILSTSYQTEFMSGLSHFFEEAAAAASAAAKEKQKKIKSDPSE